MRYMLNHPRILALFCVLTMALTARFGAWVRARFHVPEAEVKENLTLVISATLTLLGLIIGFTFSMATTRYDQRRVYEEGEANAIGTEYVRADLLPAGEDTQVKQLLRAYLDHRIKYYNEGYDSLMTLDARTEQLQTQLWKAILPQAADQPNPVTALVVSGMNDVLNSQGYTQAAWWNRIPTSAWGLMIIIALFANALIGFAARRSKYGDLLLLVLPLIVSISFFLVADIDSPRGGLIRVPPVDLMSLSRSLQRPPD
jgi:hypothetical protein